MTEHELKCWPEFFEPLLNGTKPFEVRNNDRGFRVGDVLWLREWEPGNWGREYAAGEKHIKSEPSAVSGYTGRDCRREITYLLNDPDYCKEDTVILGLSRPPLEVKP